MDFQREYENLANAIIEQAVKDYRSAAGNRRIKSEVIRFIRSGWFGILTDINPVALEEKLLAEEKGMELHEYHLAISRQERRRNKSYQGLQQYAVHP